MPPYTVYIAVGSNLGDKCGNCRNGLDALDRLEQTRIRARGGFYATEPVDYLDQDWFVNSAVRIETGLDPFALLRGLHTIEEAAGRTRDGVRFGPRTLDLDIVLFSDWIVSSPVLTLPHPRMHKRRFVLQPLCDIDPTISHPLLGQDLGTLLAALDPSQQRIVPRPCG